MTRLLLAFAMVLVMMAPASGWTPVNPNTRYHDYPAQVTIDTHWGEQRKARNDWNRRYGRFIAGGRLLEEHDGRANIELVRGDVTWVQFPADPNVDCLIHLSPDHWVDRDIIRHEIAHCLGWADSQFEWFYDSHNGQAFNNNVCDNTSHAEYSTYNGITDYCTPLNEFSFSDDCTAYALGYISRWDLLSLSSHWSAWRSCLNQVRLHPDY